MNHQEAWSLLNDFVDEALPKSRMTSVEAHLRGCSICRQEVEQLRSLINTAAALPPELEPSRDLWPDIAARSLGRGRKPASSDRFEIIRSFRSWRGFWPATLATAAVALVLLISVLHSGDGPGPNLIAGGESRSSQSEVPLATMDASATMAVDTTIDIIRALEAECQQGDYEMAAYAVQDGDDETGGSILAFFSQDLQVVNQAIAEVREAWSANPNCPRLVRLLAAAYRAKVALQGRAVESIAQS